MTDTLPSFVQAGSGAREFQLSLTTVVARGLSRVETRDRTGRIYASDGGHCERSGALLAMLPGQQRKSASLQAYAKLGDAIENIVLGALDDQNEVLFRQYHLPEVGLNLGGYVDGVIYHGGRLRLLEVKSCGSTLPKVPKPIHATQAAIYSAICGMPIIIYYMSRTVADYKGQLLTAQFDLAEDGALQRRALWRVAYAHLASKLEVTPRIPMHIQSENDCGFCPFIPVCWNGEAPLNPWPTGVTPQQHLELSREATAWVDKLLHPDVVADRRIGILNHIRKHGTETAKRLLTGSRWSDLLGSPAEHLVTSWNPEKHPAESHEDQD